MNRKYSLKKNHDIDKLVKMRRSVGNRYYAIYYMITSGICPKIAIYPSRQFRTAVERNYEKRVLREIIRAKLETLSHLKMLIVVKTASQSLTFVQKDEQITHLLKKIDEQKSTQEIK